MLDPDAPVMRHVARDRASERWPNAIKARAGVALRGVRRADDADDAEVVATTSTTPGD